MTRALIHLSVINSDMVWYTTMTWILLWYVLNNASYWLSFYFYFCFTQTQFCGHKYLSIFEMMEYYILNSKHIGIRELEMNHLCCQCTTQNRVKLINTFIQLNYMIHDCNDYVCGLNKVNCFRVCCLWCYTHFLVLFATVKDARTWLSRTTSRKYH